MGNADAPSINRSDRLHAPGEPPLWFVDVTAEVGLDFVHACGRQGEHHSPEIMGGGAAVFDYDGDGRLDLYLINSGDHLPGTGHPITVTNRLFRQEPDGHFIDVTESSGLGDVGYGMGCAVGDIDNDGDLDVFVPNELGVPDQLYRNLGNGEFEEIAQEAGVASPAQGRAALWFEYDGDRRLDLVVGGGCVRFTLTNQKLGQPKM